MDSYEAFLDSKRQLGGDHGFKPVFMPGFLFDFQAAVTEEAVRRGRSAILADCGLGKEPMSLVWGENVVRHTNGRVIKLEPLACAHQVITEAEKFGIEAHRGRTGELHPGINVVNYERLHLYDPNDFVGAIVNESSILKSFDGVRRAEITEFMRKMKYRLLATATAAPNDYIELGTSSEALGELGYTDMLGRFFKNDQNTIRPVIHRDKGRSFQQLDNSAKWRFKGHAEKPFWRWVASWARALRRPSDMGFDDAAFVLPPLIERQHDVDVMRPPDGMLLTLPAIGLKEQRDERRRTIEDRCAKVSELVEGHDTSLIWCHLNDEGDLLAKIPGAVQVSGSDSDDEKEEKFQGFATGQIKRLVTKPKIGAWGLNFQHCAHVTTFPSHSFEQYYQGVRRCWRFGQKRPVEVDIVTTEGERDVLKNLNRKAAAADRMFTELVAAMNGAMKIERDDRFTVPMEFPAWL